MAARAIGILAGLAILLAGAAHAQDYVRPDCQGLVSPGALHFDSPEHQRWYKRFWTGDCDRLSFCISGAPNWNDIVGKLLAKGGGAEQPALRPRVCRLGQMIGLEWSRERDIRRIDTGDLRTFKSILDAAHDPLLGVTRVEALARAKLAQ